MTTYRAIEYTSQFDELCATSFPELGDTIVSAEDCDAREWDSLERLLADEGLALRLEPLTDEDGDAGIERYTVVASAR